MRARVRVWGLRMYSLLLPAARMATSGLSTRAIGKFHGAMSSTSGGKG